MKIKIIYRKNLKMTENKMASQVAHVAKNLPETPQDVSIVVLKVSDKKFFEMIGERKGCYIQKDLGLTEVEPGTPTAAGWIEISLDDE
jgi:peptidyl-tRNA hydrolase